MVAGSSNNDKDGGVEALYQTNQVGTYPRFSSEDAGWLKECLGAAAPPAAPKPATFDLKDGWNDLDVPQGTLATDGMNFAEFLAPLATGCVTCPGYVCSPEATEQNDESCRLKGAQFKCHGRFSDYYVGYVRAFRTPIHFCTHFVPPVSSRAWNGALIASLWVMRAGGTGMVSRDR